MCISSGTGTAYSFGVHEITSDFHGGSCFSTFSFLCSALEIVRFTFFLFLFAIHRATPVTIRVISLE
jgi:hypothetical protein